MPPLLLDLPVDLQCLGNAEAWQKVDKLLTANAKAILVHGPVGCGKTEGLQSLLEARGFCRVHVDVTDVESADGFRKVLQRTGQSRCDGKRPAYTLDLEGFFKLEKTNVDYRATLLAFLRERPKEHAPLFLEVNDPYDLSMRDLSGLCVKVGMNAPTRKDCLAFFAEKWHGFPHRWVDAFVEAVDNDLRQVHQQLKSTAILKKLRTYQVEQGVRPSGPFVLNDELQLVQSNPDRSASVFRATDALARDAGRRAAGARRAVDEWERQCGAKAERAYFSNVPVRAQAAVEQRQAERCPTCNQLLTS